MSSLNIRDLPARASHFIPNLLERTWISVTSPRMVSAHHMPDEAFLAKFRLPDVAALLARGDTLAARQALGAHYRQRRTPTWPDPPNEIRDLRLNIHELSHEQLIALADSISEYHFVLGASPPTLTPEGTIAWGYSPTSDREWLWALNRHEWWVILGVAYARTGDERYTTAFVSIMLDWIAQNPPPIRRNERSPSWRLMEVGLRLRLSWLPCFALFQNSPVFTDTAKLTMLRSIYDHARFLMLFKTNRNHLLRESVGLACVSTYFPEFIEASRWRQIALARLDTALIQQVNRDGFHIEVSTGYQSLVIEEFQIAYDLLQSHHLTLPHQDLAAWLKRMYGAMAQLVRPDGAFPQVNDGIVFWDSAQLAEAGERFERDDWVYIGTGGCRGTLPAHTSIALTDAGLYVMRSDWTKDARYLLFDAGPYGGPHGHEDKLSIEVFAWGQAFIVDPGTYTYNRDDPFRVYFIGSQGHNTVLMDGKSQIRRWRKENLTPKTAPGDYATWITNSGFDYVSASYSEGYSQFRLDKPEQAVIIRDVIHTRRVLFVKPDYWLIVDELEASAPHCYQMLFHTAPEIVVRAGPDGRAILGTTPGAASLHLIPAGPHLGKFNWLKGCEDPIQGWYSPGWERKMPAATIAYERTSDSSTLLATLLYPCPAGQGGDQVSISPLRVSEEKGYAFVVLSNNGSDFLLFSPDSGVKRFGPYQSRGRIAVVRTDQHRNILSRFEWDGSEC